MTEPPDYYNLHLTDAGHTVRLEGDHGLLLVTGARHGMGSNEWVGKCQSMAVLLGLRGPEMFKGLNWDLYACLSLARPVNGWLADRAWFWLVADNVGDFDVKAKGHRWILQLNGNETRQWITTRLEWIDVYHRACEMATLNSGPLGTIGQVSSLGEAQAKIARQLLGEWYNRWYARLEEVAKAAKT